MAFSGMVLTTKGQLLQSKVQAGATLSFTKIKVGDGQLAQGATLEALNDLINPLLVIPIESVSAPGDGTAIVTGTLTNADLAAGFFVREIGVFATDQTAGEILYAVGNAGSQCDYLPAGGGATAVEHVLNVITAIGSASNVTAVINAGAVLATKKELTDHIGRTDNPHNVTAAQVHHDAIAGLVTADVQSSLAAIFNEAKKKGTVGRNMILSGPKDASGNPIALYSDLTNGTISLKTGTKLTFANSMDELGLPKDIQYAVLADVSTVLAAADQNTIPLRYTANLCNGGTAISGGDYAGNPASNAFDNNTSTLWQGSQAAPNTTSWIGYNFGAAKRVRKILLIQNVSNGFSAVKVQYSSDGSTWQDACNVSGLVVGTNVISVPPVASAQYWRLLCNGPRIDGASGGGSVYGVQEIEMYEAFQTHYLYADYVASAVNLLSSKSGPRNSQQNNVVFVDGYYTTDQCVGGTAISGGDYSSQVASNAFDNTTGDYWGSSQISANQSGNAYIGYQFSTAKAIRRVKYSNYSQQINGITSVKVQYSDNGSIWTDALTSAVSNVGYATNTLDIPNIGTHTYWRLLANANLTDTATWAVTEIEMLEYVEPTTITINDDVLYSDNLCVGGSAVSSGDATGYTKENAFDINTTTYWASSQATANQLGSAYIGYDFGIDKAVKRIKVTQRTDAAATVMTSSKVQYSDNGSAWTDVVTTALVAGLNIINVDSGAHRYWRLLANASLTSGNSWDVVEITMQELSNDVYVYDPETGKSKHYDGVTWTEVTRIFVGSADVDSSGKIVAVYPETYNLAQLRLRDAENSYEPVTLGQFPCLLSDDGWTALPNGFILQWGPLPVTMAIITFPIMFPHACLIALPQTFYNSTGSIAAQYNCVIAKTKTTFTLAAAGSYLGGTWIAVGK